MHQRRLPGAGEGDCSHAPPTDAYRPLEPAPVALLRHHRTAASRQPTLTREPRRSLDAILGRHEVDAGLLSVLVERLAPSELQSVLLEVFRRRAGALTPALVLDRYKESRFVQPSPVDPVEFATAVQAAWAALPAGYSAVELSPLVPLGTHSAMASVHQDRVVTTIRGTEVAADATAALALECARRRRRADVRVGLVAVQRQVRAQLFTAPGLSPHFTMLAMATAGRARPRAGFEGGALLDQIGYAVEVVRALHPGWSFRLELIDLSGRAKAWEELVLAPLDRRCADLRWSRHLEDAARPEGAYYERASYKLFAGPPDGPGTWVCDGGCAPWTAALLSDRKERLVVSGLALERLLPVEPPA